MDSFEVGLSTGLVLGFVSIFIIMYLAFCDDYKSGQTDALSGIIKYEKATHENQTVTWELITTNKGE